MTNQFQEGQRVICNGYQGVIKTMHIGQLAGMADVRLNRGTVCVSIADLKLENTHVHDFTLQADDMLQCACGTRRCL